MVNTANIDSLLQLIPKRVLSELIQKWEVDKNTSKLKTTDLLRAVLGAFVLRLPNFREINLVFGVPKSTLADALRTRSCGFFEELCEHVVELLRSQSDDRKLKRALRQIYAIDSSEIKVHGSMIRFPGFEQSLSKNAGAKIHVVWNVQKHWVEGFHTTNFNASDLRTAKRSLYLLSDVTYVFDKAYVDLNFWLKITERGSHFVTRLRETPRNNDLKKQFIGNDSDGVLYDGNWLPSDSAAKRRVKRSLSITFRQIIYRDPETKRVFHFITSDFEASAQTIADIYKKRWAVELFFRWLKGQLNIRRLHLKSKNGVKSILAMALLMQLLLELKRTAVKFRGTLTELLRLIRSMEIGQKLIIKGYQVKRPAKPFPKKKFRIARC